MAAQQDCASVNFAVAVGCPELTYGCPDNRYGDKKKQEVVFVGKPVIKVKFEKPYPEKKYHTVSDNNKSSHKNIFPVCQTLGPYPLNFR
jgi:hypothetical protein